MNYFKKSFALPYLMVPFLILSLTTLQAVNPSQWMTELKPIIGDKKLHEIFIPGTHDSGSWALGGIPLAKTQSRDFKGQLEAGARYFDLRITYMQLVPGYEANTFYLHHGGASHAALKLSTQLQAVKTFLDQHPNEVVILHVRNNWLCNGIGIGNCDDMTSQQKTQLTNLFKSYFPGNRLATTNEVQSQNINYLTSNRKIVIDWYSNSAFADITWLNYLDIDHLTPIQEKINRMEAYHTQQLREAASIEGLNALHPVIAGIDVYATAKQYAFPNTKKWLDNWYQDPTTRKGLNIVAVDFIEASGVFEQLMQFNQNGKTSGGSASGVPEIQAALWYGTYNGSEKTYLFGTDQYYRYDKGREASGGPYSMSEWKVPGHLYTLDAALYYGQYRGSEMTYLFKGTQYYSYNKTTDELKGPFDLHQNWKLPNSWQKVDAAVYYGQYQGSEMVYFFNGTQYYSYNKSTDEAKGPYDLHRNWKVPNHWKTIDAALYYGNYRGGETIYLFNGSEYGRYNKSTDQFDGPYPISQNWF
ncbi:MAG: hypothetical protein KDC44_10640 [Phaeodactylibacter sp.]|nr:hypothetical protein [Phaeodactylibacter sp.]